MDVVGMDVVGMDMDVSVSNGQGHRLGKAMEMDTDTHMEMDIDTQMEMDIDTHMDVGTHTGMGYDTRPSHGRAPGTDVKGSEV